MTPFVYIIVSVRNELYVGSKYAINAHPDQLLTTYFTSSRFVEPLAKENPGEWKIERLQIVGSAAEAVALEAVWQREHKGHPGFMNRRIINEEFVFDGSGVNNPMFARWTLRAPDGTIYEQPNNMMGRDFIASLGHSIQMLMKYRKLGELPYKGSFAGWQILACKRGDTDLLDGTTFKIAQPKSKQKTPPKVKYRGTPEHRAEVAARNKRLSAAFNMHNDASWKKISEKSRARSDLCNGKYIISLASGDVQVVTDLLEYADNHSLARNTIRHLLKTGLTAKQGPCRGMSIVRQL